MGQLESEFQFTGRLGNVTAYRMRGVDKIIVRQRGGASRERIKKERSFANTRKHNTEFTGRAMGVRNVRHALIPAISLADYNFVGNINKILKYVQDRDTEHDLGKRNILFSRYGALLQGFSLNRYVTFDSVIRIPPMCDFTRDTLTARVHIPELVRGINFFPPQKHAHFQLMAVLGIVPDLFITKKKYQPSDERYLSIATVAHSSTPWMPVTAQSPGTTLEVKLSSQPPDEACAFVLSVGLCFGASDGQTIVRTRHAGCARILSVISNANSV